MTKKEKELRQIIKNQQSEINCLSADIYKLQTDRSIYRIFLVRMFGWWSSLGADNPSVPHMVRETAIIFNRAEKFDLAQCLKEAGY